MTRIIDILLSVFGLIILLPFLPVIAFFIKVDSKGPVFYACKRVGQGGRIFNMYKFRTMYETPVQLGPSLSPQGDPRVTPVGRILRRLKLNEFPQFFNVLKGDMTLVGPRPEAPDLAAAYPEDSKVLFTVKPGLAGPNQILGRNEEEFYPPGVDPVQFYIEHILPKKIPIDMQYIADKSLMKNFKYIFLAVRVTLTKAINRQHLWENRSQVYLMLADMATCAFSFTLAHLLRYESFSSRESLQVFLILLPLAVLVRLPIFIYFGLYHTLIRHLSIFDIKRIFKGVAFSSLIMVALSFLSGLAITTKPMVSSYSRSVFLIDWVLLTILLVMLRLFLKKMYLRYRAADDPKDAKRVLIWGAGDGGELCLRYLEKNQNPSYNVVGFLDDDSWKRGRQIGGYKILGDRHHLKILAQLYKIQEVLVAIPSVTLEELQKIIAFCQELGLEANLFQFSPMACTNLHQDSMQPVNSVSGVASVPWIPSLDHTAGKI
jgi:lipopolysaccharide/colanic/teichoic acid biosynthesis glycosyltransferase